MNAIPTQECGSMIVINQIKTKNKTTIKDKFNLKSANFYPDYPNFYPDFAEIVETVSIAYFETPFYLFVF